MRAGTLVVLTVAAALAIAACQGGMDEADVERLVQERVEAATAELMEQLRTDLVRGLQAARQATGTPLELGESGPYILDGELVVQGRIVVQESPGAMRIVLEPESGGGSVAIHNGEGERVVGLSTVGGNGTVSLSNASGDLNVLMSGGNGGSIGVLDSGDVMAVIGTSQFDNGYVALYAPNERLLYSLP
ncbi:MAG: hypothetical protein OXT51_03320 [Chloroflexota bacterium]|nr:hypothetical protein [Chloroflexota bacterium]